MRMGTNVIGEIDQGGQPRCSVPAGDTGLDDMLQNAWRRRSFLKALAGLGIYGVVPACELEDKSRREPWEIPVASAINISGGGYRMASLSGPGGELWQHPTALRGHAVVVDPRGEDLILVARRPGNAIWIASKGASSWRQKRAALGRHYFGHGCFSADGRLLYLSENVFEDYNPALPVEKLLRESVVGVYDRDAGYEKISELPAHGIGSHELALMAGQDCLVVAHGGYYTHPDLPRQILNPGQEQPALVYLDQKRGTLLEKVQPFDPQMSVRHFDIALDGQVVVGLQYGGPMEAKVPLVMSHRRGEAIRYWEIPEALRSSLRQYTASVAIHAPSGRVAVSAPKGNAILFFESEGRFLHRHELSDAAGLDALSAGFVASSGSGRLELIDANTLEVAASADFEGVQWDNHLTVWRG